jgi:hypothetical protein
MGAVAIGMVLGGKLKYEKEYLEKSKAFIDRNEGSKVMIRLSVAGEIDFKKDLDKYYYEYMLPQITSALVASHKYFSDEQEVRTNAFLCHKFLSYEIDFNGFYQLEEVTMQLRIEDVNRNEKINFIAAVAFFAQRNLNIEFKPTTNIF